jgi:hypothetical protein
VGSERSGEFSVRTVQQLIGEVGAARGRFLAAAGDPSPVQAAFKPAPDSWSMTEITEHITLAEQAGINGMWKALEGLRSGRPVWSGELVHRGRSIQEVVAATWQEKEQVPSVAAPRWGGPFAYWAAALRACQPLLAELGEALEAVDLARVVYPHPISGPLDARQRLEFLRFHLDRHTAQIQRVRRNPAFPREGGAV